MATELERKEKKKTEEKKYIIIVFGYATKVPEVK